MGQVQSLLKPVQDEDERLNMVAGDLLHSSAIKTKDQQAPSVENLDVDVQTEAEKSKSAAQEKKEKDQINSILL
jgi:hypothetical protein